MASLICFNFWVALQWSGSWTRWSLWVSSNRSALFCSKMKGERAIRNPLTFPKSALCVPYFSCQIYLRNLGIDQSPGTILTPFVPRGPIREVEFSPSELRTLKDSTDTLARTQQPQGIWEGKVSWCANLGEHRTSDVPVRLFMAWQCQACFFSCDALHHSYDLISDARYLNWKNKH